MVTVVLSVLLHEALHEVDRCHVTGLGQQVAGVPTGRDQTHKHKGANTSTSDSAGQTAIKSQCHLTRKNTGPHRSPWPGSFTYQVTWSVKPRGSTEIMTQYMLVVINGLSGQLFYRYSSIDPLTRCRRPAPGPSGRKGWAAGRGSQAVRAGSAPGHESPTSFPQPWPGGCAPSRTLSSYSSLLSGEKRETITKANCWTNTHQNHHKHQHTVFV